jgi:E3 ubiquitin-protein ligase TRIP12
MGAVVAFDFNPAFFALLRGKPVEMADVDTMLASSLANPEDLLDLPFSYPGIAELEMRPGEVTTMENFGEYAALVKEYTCGGKLRQVAKAWKSGFSAVIPWSAMAVFTEREICAILRGNLAPFTLESLYRNIEIAHGYNSESPTVKMLFDTIVEFSSEERALFLKFVTGCKALPVGGLDALAPKLTVALRVVEGESPDMSFPSVMTCANYLKLPEYSSQEILREKLIFAIYECQNCFELT